MGVTVPMVPTTINGRWTLLLPEHRAARQEWFTGWEKERLAAMADCIRPGDLVYDIGAEEGDFPALWASWGADVVLVEPNPKVWANIRAIFEANDVENRVRGWFVGFAGDELRDRPAWNDEHVEPPDDPRTDWWPSCAYGPVIGDHGFLVIPERPDCPITTIDRLAEFYGPPTVITIDVEGAELTVLRGAHRTLVENRPRVFVSCHTDIEWMTLKFEGDEFPALDAYMRSLGYEGTHLATDHERHMCYLHPDGR